MQHSAFSGSEVDPLPTPDEYENGYVAKNDNKIDVSTQLTKAYDEFSHVISLGTSYSFDGSDKSTGFYSYNEEFCRDSTNANTSRCEFYNITETQRESEVYFSQYIYWGIGGTADSGDDEGGYNTYIDIAFAWDYSGLGQPGQWGPVGVAAYAFLESPGNPFDGIDNDEDGVIDEKRDNSAGQWLDAYPYGVVDVDAFVEFYGRDTRSHWEGDEDQDWSGFSDDNDIGNWDIG